MKLAQLSTRTLVGGLFGLSLSFVFAENSSQGLFDIYSSSTLFRNVTGNAPNILADGVNKISWAIFFCSCWWMLWKFDLFFTPIPQQSTELPEEPPSFARNKTSQKEKEEESFKPEEEEDKKSDPQTKQDSKAEDFLPKQHFDDKDQRFLETLNLSEESITDFDSIKSVYRKKIAQYHPDKVLAMGPEIREVADKKAKEINEAYEHFRKKFSS